MLGAKEPSRVVELVRNKTKRFFSKTKHGRNVFEVPYLEKPWRVQMQIAPANIVRCSEYASTTAH